MWRDGAGGVRAVGGPRSGGPGRGPVPVRGGALAVIPARIGSTRLARKPLLPLLGRPLVEWVWRRVVDLDLFERVVVATDSEEVRRVCAGFGADVVLTGTEHPSGTHRVAEVAEMGAFRRHPVLVNVQGDEPLVVRDELEGAIRQVTDRGWALGTVATPLDGVAAWRDPNVVKVVRGADGRALYFSRAPIPWKRDGEPGPDEWESGRFLRHVGIYAYGREALLRWAGLAPSPLEGVERLEQLRPLDSGMEMGVAVVAASAGGVDTPEDVARVEDRLRREERVAEGGSPSDHR